jgi:hypothetical protein
MQPAEVVSRLLVGLLATLGAAGCRTAGTAPIAHNRPPETRPRSSFDVEEFVAEHNQDAERIRSLEAKPSITVKYWDEGRKREGQVDGRLALERPRNFKLQMSAHLSTIADIGSNDERFWFWVQSRKDKSVYVCDYADLGSTSLAATYQPDWIVEAMGLKPISADEAAQIKVRPGQTPGTTALIFPATGSGGQAYSRIMIVSDLTRNVQEFRVLSSDGQALLAQATIRGYKEKELPVAQAEGRTPRARETCRVPEDFTLEWKREQLVLVVALREPQVNQFDSARRAALFVEPTLSGYTRVNLAELSRQKEPHSSTEVRETIPVPEAAPVPGPRDRPRLGRPLGIREDSAAVKPPRRTDQDLPRGPVLLPVFNPDEEVIGAPLPAPPGAAAERTISSVWPAPSPSLER